MSDTYYRTFTSPVGRLTLAGDGQILSHLVLASTSHPLTDSTRWIERGDVYSEVIIQLTEYFNGARFEFNIPCNPSGTAFQRHVWQALCEIPYGETRSYGQIARSIGKPAGARAVGLANANNPIAIIIPCHRVIGANGSLTGYSGGLEIKRTLLALENNSRPNCRLVPEAR